MSLFRRKPKLSVQEFSRDFYDSALLDTLIQQAHETYCQVIKRSIEDVDARFATVDSKEFAAEIAAIRFEVFGLAWLHHFGDKFAAPQSAFTKTYLEEKHRPEIWEAMERYNRSIARSFGAFLKSGTAEAREQATRVNLMKSDTFDYWVERGYDGTAVARAANRLGARAAWEAGLSQGFLAVNLCEVLLGHQLNEDAEFRLIAFIRGFYDGAYQACEAVTILGF